VSETSHREAEKAEDRHLMEGLLRPRQQQWRVRPSLYRRLRPRRGKKLHWASRSRIIGYQTYNAKFRELNIEI
jgi:ribosomal protein L15E